MSHKNANTTGTDTESSITAMHEARAGAETPTGILRSQPEDVPIAAISIVPQWRRPLVPRHVAALRQALWLPPILVTHDLRLVDGWHRLTAMRDLGRPTIEVQRLPRETTEVELLACAVQANARQGLKLTTAQRNQAVIDLLLAGCEWSNRRLAETCGVSKDRIPDLIAEAERLVDERSGVPHGHVVVREGQLRVVGNTRVGRDGKRYPFRSKSRTISEDSRPNEDWLARIRAWAGRMFRTCVRFCAELGLPRAGLH